MLKAHCKRTWCCNTGNGSLPLGPHQSLIFLPDLEVLLREQGLHKDWSGEQDEGNEPSAGTGRAIV